MLRFCVFCGSSLGVAAEYANAARELGEGLASANVGLVFGGSLMGLMGRVAEAALDAGGDVVGVIPDALMKREIAFDRLTDLRIVGSMHERKALMAELSDGFIALPGGFGTLDEFFEIVTWAQLGIHHKPIGLLNVGGYFDKLIEFVQVAETQGFIRREHHRLFCVEASATSLVGRINAAARLRAMTNGEHDMVELPA